MKIQIRFDAPPGPQSGYFIEVEDETGKSISAGEWVADGSDWLLKIDTSPEFEQVTQLRRAIRFHLNSRTQDKRHSESCPKHECIDEMCDGTTFSQNADDPPRSETCHECAGQPCECGLFVLYEALEKTS